MSKSTSFGYTDTADGGVTTKTFTRANLNHPVDFVPLDVSDMSYRAANKTSPIDQQEIVRVQATEIADIYKGTPIDPSAYAASRKGISIVAQVNDVLRVTESTDATFQVDLPISAHIVVKAPLSANVTAANVEAVIGRALALLYNSNDVTTTRVGNLLRGAMKPSGV
jgi:hypothetical protein